MKASELIELTKNYFSSIEEMTHRLTSGNVSHLGATMKLYAKDAANYLEMEIDDPNFTSIDDAYELLRKSVAWFRNIEDCSARLTTGNVSHMGTTIRGMALRSREYLIKHN